MDTDSNAWSFLHTGGALNRAGYANPQVDELLDRARTVSDTRERRAAYEGVWQQVSKDLPIIYLWTPRNIVGLSNKVAGFTLLADGLLRLQDVHPVTNVDSDQCMRGAAMRRIVALACTALHRHRHRTRRHDTSGQHRGRPHGFDPEAMVNNTSGFIMATVFDGLVSYKPGTIEVSQAWRRAGMSRRTD